MIAGRKSRIVGAVIMFFTVALLDGCSSRLKTEAVLVGDMVCTRPEGTIGPKATSMGGPWRTILFHVPSNKIRENYTLGSTFHVTFTNCHGGFLSVEDAYSSGLAINTISHARKGTIESLTAHPEVNLTVFIDEEVYEEVPKLCFQIEGGSMAFQSFSSELVRVPSVDIKAKRACPEARNPQP